MANVNIPTLTIVKETLAVRSAFAAITASDTGILPTGSNRCILHLLPSGAAANVQIVAPDGKNLALPTINASIHAFLPLFDTADYAQPDGTVHIITDSLVDVVALVG